MERERNMQRIVIAGGGTAGWMAAAALSRFLNLNATSQWSVTLVESEDIGTVGVGEATIPQIHLFNQSLGIDENEFVRATQGSFKLGIEFAGWGAPGESYLHAFGNIGRGLGLIPYHHYWLAYHMSGGEADLWSASPTAHAALQNRFGRVADKPGAPPSGVAYAYHFDASLYAAFLRRYAEKGGVKRIEGKIDAVQLDNESGDIRSLKLSGEREIEGDLFIDCTGFRGLLIEGALGSGYDDWSHWLPCNRAWAVPCESVSPLTPYTGSTARQAGWQWRIPLQHRTGNGHVYCSDYISDDEAAQVLLDNLDGAALADPRQLHFTTGKRKHIWKKNCVALGLSSGFLEPLESTSIHLIQSGIARLLNFLPSGEIIQADVDEFNVQSDFEFAAIRDFIILHYHLNGREGAFWERCRTMDIPQSLSQKIALFSANGRITRHNEELFTELGWLQVMWGQGLRPTGHHPLAKQLTPPQINEFIGLATRHAANVAAQMPDHAAFIAANCAAGVN
jgi:tryptophan 7-halogenase